MPQVVYKLIIIYSLSNIIKEFTIKITYLGMVLHLHNIVGGILFTGETRIGVHTTAR